MPRGVPRCIQWALGLAVGEELVNEMARMAWGRASRQRHTKGVALLLGSGVPPRGSPWRRHTHRPSRRQEHLAQAVQVERGHVQV
jgi:hypothetical protein